MWIVLTRLFPSLAFLSGSYLFAQCLNLAKGELLVDVRQCKVVEAPKDFSRQFDPKFFAQMTPNDQRNFLASYQGRFYKALVVESKAESEGLGVKKGVLKGQEIVFFERGLGCENIAGKRLRLQLNQACCDGGIDAPCLLSTSYVTTSSQVIGEAGSGAGDPQREDSHDEKNKLGLAARKAFTSKKFREVIKILAPQVADQSLSQVDLRYMLALSYRQVDQCERAVPILEQIDKDFKASKVFADQQKWADESDFLRARCYARLGQPELAIVILDAYLVDPKKYRQRIQQSLRHKDFGWMNASKEYQRYRVQAEQALSKK